MHQDLNPHIRALIQSLLHLPLSYPSLPVIPRLSPDALPLGLDLPERWDVCHAKSCPWPDLGQMLSFQLELNQGSPG